MKRMVCSLALLAALAQGVMAQEEVGAPRPLRGLLAAPAQPAPPTAPQSAPQPPQPGRQHRFRISSYGAWVRTTGPGYPAYRYTYRGETSGFLRPTLFTYGYEHEYQDNGPFTLNGQWH